MQIFITFSVAHRRGAIIEYNEIKKSSHDKGGRKGSGFCCVSDNSPSGWINKVAASIAYNDDDENYQNPPNHPYNHPHYHHSIAVIYYTPYCQITVYNVTRARARTYTHNHIYTHSLKNTYKHTRTRALHGLPLFSVV
jgi:hypothetical protein